MRDYGRRLFSWWRQPRPAALRTYLSARFDAERFTAEGISAAPNAPGVYLLYHSGRLIYIGCAQTAIRQELERHRRGVYGACTQGASAFDYEVTRRPAEAQRDYLLAHMARYGGRLPPCNQGR